MVVPGVSSYPQDPLWLVIAVTLALTYLGLTASLPPRLLGPDSDLVVWPHGCADTLAIFIARVVNKAVVTSSSSSSFHLPPSSSFPPPSSPPLLLPPSPASLPLSASSFSTSPHTHRVTSARLSQRFTLDLHTAFRSHISVSFLVAIQSHGPVLRSPSPASVPCLLVPLVALGESQPAVPVNVFLITCFYWTPKHPVQPLLVCVCV